MKIGFIGGGNMAAAMIGGMLKKGFEPVAIRVAEPVAERRAWLAGEFGVLVEESAADCLDADVLVLAVKPQQLSALLRGLPPLKSGCLVLSIAAGVRATDIARWLGGHGAVARAMPNTPALVGEGITGLYALPGVGASQRDQATRVLEAVGQVVWVDTEAGIDLVTAISGSGPAYVFYFIEALEQAGVALGLPAETARQLTLRTFLGASTLAVQDAASPTELRARVTSKGGTTERGILALEEGGVKDAIARAAQAAAERARELGDILGRD
ncbi:MAG TPA: pyrroline-5-carboxylate reductase [Thiobacillaceae bacterium]|nr:pyrroline-5-carboxylate reductase [Thiobacillaceae bacterium]HNA82824.1 pyrroline-5-carboxylate reductase [Thiobacillaceae bacterium]HNF89585.1 pyrroline-5-carboxylate reductase [Thiobacillaceae bacterium]HNH89598.1 pyrroline-5-carboxylate reductase [Thiobacillaceae bacterium]HNI07730.1 pyrroline-5-carboxylate reductase [Thiobacillaceae bacterium]